SCCPAPDAWLFADRVRGRIASCALFTGDDGERLAQQLLVQLEKGDGLPVLARIEESKYRPSKNLMEHVGGMSRGKPEYVLLDEQLVVFEKVLACARAGFDDRRKTVLLVKGGPGT